MFVLICKRKILDFLSHQVSCQGTAKKLKSVHFVHSFDIFSARSIANTALFPSSSPLGTFLHFLGKSLSAAKSP